MSARKKHILCAYCRYEIQDSPVCPECGKHVPTARRNRKRQNIIRLSALFVTLATISYTAFQYYTWPRNAPDYVIAHWASVSPERIQAQQRLREELRIRRDSGRFSKQVWNWYVSRYVNEAIRQGWLFSMVCFEENDGTACYFRTCSHEPLRPIAGLAIEMGFDDEEASASIYTGQHSPDGTVNPGFPEPRTSKVWRVHRSNTEAPLSKVWIRVLSESGEATPKVLCSRTLSANKIARSVQRQTPLQIPFAAIMQMHAEVFVHNTPSECGAEATLRLFFCPVSRLPPDVAVGMQIQVFYNDKPLTDAVHLIEWEDEYGNNLVPYLCLRSKLLIPLKSVSSKGEGAFTVKITGCPQVSALDSKRDTYWSGTEVFLIPE